MTPWARLVALSAVCAVAACASPAQRGAEAPAETLAAPTEEGTPAPAELDPSPPSEAPPASVAAVDPDVGRPRIGSVRFITWVSSAPGPAGRKIGYLREGTAAVLRSVEGVAGGGCKGKWYAIEPHGFVCGDSSTTRDLESPLYKALTVAAQNKESVMPYRYAFSKGAPMYGKVPTPAEQLKAEGDPEKRPKPEDLRWTRSHEELAETTPIEPTDELPSILKDGKHTPVHYGDDKRTVRKWIPNGSMLAYSHAFKAEGRVWLLSPDLTVIPADRVRRFRTSTFHGVELREGTALPLAWARHDPAPRYTRKEGAFVPTSSPLPPRTFVRLATERIEEGKRVFLETAEAGVFVLESAVAVMRARDKIPIGVLEGDKWLDVRIRAGTLVAYVGLKPVFATLVSPGAGGVGPWGGSNAELVRLSTTPLGTYRMIWKTRAAPMSPETGEPTKFWIADVPDTQYFRHPFAIHTAYWHEDFGMPKSAGCINVSPEDGRRLFAFTDPPVPSTWQGMGPSKEGGLGTVIVITP